MIDRLTPQDIQDGRMNLKELFQEVAVLEGTLAGGKRQGPGSALIESLLQTKIWFGDPRNNLTHLTARRFQKMKIAMTEPQKIQLASTDWAFYYMTLTVSIQPEAGATFTRLIHDLTFSCTGPSDPLIQSLFPTSKWSEALRVGGNMRVGVNANLEIGADLSQLPEEITKVLPGHLKAHAQADLHLDVVTAQYSFQFGHAEILATGQESPHCYWRFERFNMQRTQTAQFCLVFKVPSTTTHIRLQAVVGLLPSINWLIGGIRHLFTDLSHSAQSILGQQAKNPELGHLLVGETEEWMIELPA